MQLHTVEYDTRGCIDTKQFSYPGLMHNGLDRTPCRGWGVRRASSGREGGKGVCLWSLLLWQKAMHTGILALLGSMFAVSGQGFGVCTSSPWIPPAAGFQPTGGQVCTGQPCLPKGRSVGAKWVKCIREMGLIGLGQLSMGLEGWGEIPPV